MLRYGQAAAHGVAVAKLAQSAGLGNTFRSATRVASAGKVRGYTHDIGLSVPTASADGRVALRRRKRVRKLLVLPLFTMVFPTCITNAT